MTPQIQQVVQLHRRRWPEISEQEALADLWGMGIKCNETFAAYNQRMADAEDDRHNVIKHPDALAGWHVGWVEDWKPGVLKYFATRPRGLTGHESKIGFIGLNVLRVAIETHVIAKPNGFTLP